MLAIRVAMLALLAAVACTSLAHAAEEPLQDFENNEVLPENDVVKARVDEVPATTAAPPTSPSSSATPDDTPTATPAEDDDDSSPQNDAPAATEAPAKPHSSLGQFLTEIIQFPIAVLRSVGSLLSNTFSSERRTAATATTTAMPIDA